MKPLPYDKVKQLIPGESTVQTQTSNSTFNLEERARSYVVSGIEHQGQTYTWEVKTDELLGEKDPKNLEGWLAHNEKARETDDYGVLSAPQYHSLFLTIYEHRNDEQHKDAIEQLRNKLAARLATQWVCTMSKVKYVPQEQDMVTHNVGMTDEYTGQYDLVGKDGNVTALNDGSTYCEAIVGDARVSKVSDIYEWLSRNKVSVLRVECKPKLRNDERLVVLGVTGGFYIDVVDGIVDYFPALGVREVHP